MNMIYYLTICISLFILSTIRIAIIRQKFKEKHPIVEMLQRNTEIDWNVELYNWLCAFIVITMPILNLIFFVHIFTKSEDQFEKEWSEEFNL